jgi:hypothetical protein
MIAYVEEIREKLKRERVTYVQRMRKRYNQCVYVIFETLEKRDICMCIRRA